MDDQVLFERFDAVPDVMPPAGAFDRLRAKLDASPVRPRSRLVASVFEPSPRVMRLVAAALIVVVAAASAGTFLAIYELGHSPVPVQPPPVATAATCATGVLHMSTEEVGWRGTSRTTDGGATWRDVSPSALPNWAKGGGATCVLDAYHAWTTQNIGTSLGLPDHVVVFATSDGGQTWHQGTPVAIAGAVPAPGEPLVYVTDALEFINDRDGWLLTDTGLHSSTPYVRTLYSTTDGGLHWSLVASESPSQGSALGQAALGCFVNGMSFASLEDGWITWDCTQTHEPGPTAGPVVIATHDGGSTWQPARLPSFPTGQICNASPPLFSGNVGLLPVWCAADGTAIFTTADAGKTWSGTKAPFSAPVSQLDFLDVSTGFAFSNRCNGNDLYRSTDGGRSWTAVKRGLFAGNCVDQFQFINSTVGFVYTSPMAGVPWRTTDGGLTWSLACASNSKCSPPPAFP